MKTGSPSMSSAMAEPCASMKVFSAALSSLLIQRHHALFGELPQRLAQLLGLHRVADDDAAQDFRGEAWHAAKDEILALGQSVADA